MKVIRTYFYPYIVFVLSNLGDVIEKDNRIYGDGVNIAARVECLKRP
jgi:class 3 adenylate cyclase